MSALKQVMVSKKITVNLEWSGVEWWATFPTLPGTFTVGRSLRTLRKMISEVTEFATKDSDFGLNKHSDLVSIPDNYEQIGPKFIIVKELIWVNKNTPIQVGNMTMVDYGTTYGIDK